MLRGPHPFLFVLGSSFALASGACSSGSSADAPAPDDGGVDVAEGGSSTGDSSAVDTGGGADAGDAAREGGVTGDTDRVDTTVPPADGSGESLASSFVFVGCNRLKKGDWDPTANPSSANVPQLTQTFVDIVAMPDAPRFFFMTGDLVLGLQTDATIMAGQLDAWATLYKAAPIAAKVPVVPIVGNHEMLYKDKAAGVELSNGPSDAVWTTWLAAQGFDAHAGNGPTRAAPNADALQDDQSKLSYSYDDGPIHFVVLDTDTWTTTADPATGSTQIGWIALEWLKADLAAAQASAGVSSIFVFGHKPIVSPTGKTGSDATINPSLVPELETLLDGTAKVKGYFCAHAHQWDAQRLPGSRGVYQVVAGNGGSPLESGWAVASPYYGFTEARVYTSGRVGVVSHQRPVPSPYYATSTVAATPVAELTIAP
ncbi:MAG: hypothetical protein NVS3B10_24520 [Polyangiales bacterium]